MNKPGVALAADGVVAYSNAEKLFPLSPVGVVCGTGHG
jgi:hypothetical protein